MTTAHPHTCAEQRLFRLGQIKTWTFLTVYSLFAIGVITYYGGVPQTRAVTVLQPSLSQYQNIASRDPTCTCASALTGADAFTMTLPATVDYRNGNQCASIRYIMDAATDPVSQVVLWPYAGFFPVNDTRLLTNAFVLKLHLLPMYRLCLQLESAVVDAVSTIRQAPLGATLLSNAVVTDRMFRLAYNSFRDVLVRADTLQLTLDTISSQNLMAVSDASLGNVYTSPTNCSCAVPYIATTNASSNLGTASSPCFFRPGWDPDATRNGYYTCSVMTNVMRFPMALFTTDTLSSTFGVARADLPVPLRPQSYSTFVHLMTLPVFDTVINPTAQSTDGVQALLRANVARIDFDRYFAACRPASCTYLETSTISGIDAVVALFSILGGALTLLFQAVNICGDFCATRVCRVDLPGEDDPPVYSRRGSVLASTRNLPVPDARAAASRRKSELTNAQNASSAHVHAANSAWTENGAAAPASVAVVTSPTSASRYSTAAVSPTPVSSPVSAGGDSQVVEFMPPGATGDDPTPMLPAANRATSNQNVLLATSGLTRAPPPPQARLDETPVVSL